MTQKKLDARDWKAILRARTNRDGTPKLGYKHNVEAIRKYVVSNDLLAKPIYNLQAQ